MKWTICGDSRQEFAAGVGAERGQSAVPQLQAVWGKREDRDMNEWTCRDVERDLWRYVDRELAATELAAVSAHLKACAACSAAYHDCVRESRLYRGALLEVALGGDVAARTVAAVQNRDVSAGEVVSESRVERWRPFLLAAALLVAVSLTVLVVQRSGEAPVAHQLGSFSSIGRAVEFERAGQEGLGEAADAGPCRVGDVYRVAAGSRLRLTFTDGDGDAAVEAVGPMTLTVGHGTSTQGLRLQQRGGVLYAAVAPRRASETFEVVTEQALVTVVGTEFTVDDREPSSTQLVVTEGTVRLRALRTEEETLVSAPGERFVRFGRLEPLDGVESAPSIASETPGVGAASVEGREAPVVSSPEQVGTQPTRSAVDGLDGVYTPGADRDDE